MGTSAYRLKAPTATPAVVIRALQGELFGPGTRPPAGTARADLFSLPQPELTSTPNFVVEVIKNGGKKALVLDCHYPEDEVCRVACPPPWGRGGPPGTFLGPFRGQQSRGGRGG